ncbi:Hsp70 family protein [Frigoriglobus tundricola]|uniref:Chaperone protein DnaK n=1 Tax=Frigoriglobus tundricola TaxID=2774151 RepID=A0A6M5YU36_9BACT|nr:Hsp70 family protein [Frigoriglobus tundricola]QJW97558.1 Chaperone protein DnaK [Frigoriglobus tundricola]
MSLIGIDLGTTFCAVAALDERGRPFTVPNRDGDVLTPSAVYLAPDGSAVVGQSALDMALEQPDRVATLIKRRMGLPDYGRPVAGREYRPEALSAVILKKLAQDAEAQLGPVTGCVVTVPAYFDDTRRKATMDAGRIAGLNVIDIIDEPSAAALAYAVQQTKGEPPPPQTVLVYDLGGGTFDVTLVKLGRKRFQVLAIEGDVRLGGRDWDERLVNWAADKFVQQFGDDPRADPQSLAHLYATAERAKRALSKMEHASLTVSHGGHKVTLPLPRPEFEAITRDLLVRTRLTTQQVVRQAKVTWDAVDRVLMVGGSTHMPACGRMLTELTGRAPDHSLAVSEVVARGAAVHAGIRADTAAPAGQAPVAPDLADVVEISVNAHSLGVEVRSGAERVNDKLIPKNTQLPAAVVRVYSTAADNQTRVRVRILQGEAHQAEACIPVGECWIDGLPPNLPKGSPVRVKCGVAANGRIEVTATDQTSGRAASASIHRPGGLSDDELARAAEWVRGLKIQ